MTNYWIGKQTIMGGERVHTSVYDNGEAWIQLSEPKKVNGLTWCWSEKQEAVINEIFKSVTFSCARQHSLSHQLAKLDLHTEKLLE